MNIGKFSVERPVAVTMRIAALFLLGWICLFRLPIDLLPKVANPQVSVNVNWPNTAPEEIETQIARPIEQAVGTVKGLYMVSSSSYYGGTNIRIQFNYGVNIDQAAIDVMQLVQRAQGRFPRDPNISPPSIWKNDPSTLPILAYGVKSKTLDLVQLRAYLTNEISPQIEAAGGVAAVNISGGRDRAILVELDPEKLVAFRLNVRNIVDRLGRENLSLPAGTAIEGRTQFNLRSIGYFKSVEEIGQLPVGLASGQTVTLNQVAKVRDSSQEFTSYTRLNGEPALNVTVVKQSDSNTVETSRNVEAAIAKIAERDRTLTFDQTYNQARFITKSIVDLQETAIIGGVLAILIITFFLRNLRSTFVVALSIPISIVSTFALMYFCGFTLNTISLSGLALASGLIVDDAIVVLENIYRHIEHRRLRPAEAAVSGTQEILSAVFASTFTVMIVFMPLFLIQGQSGQVFGQFALVVIFSIAVSLLDATTVVPMLASRMIREKDVHVDPSSNGVSARVGRWLDRLDSNYRSLLGWSLAHRSVVVGIGVIAILGAYVLWPMVGKEQLPQSDSGNLDVRLRLPIGTTLAITDKAVQQMEGILAKDPDVKTIFAGSGANVGLRGSGGGAPHEGSAMLLLREDRKVSTSEVMKRLQKKLAVIPGARMNVQPLDIVQRVLGNNNGFSVDVYGQDLEKLTEAGQMIQKAMAEIPGLQNVDLNVQEALPEIRWKVNRESLSSLGLSFQDVANALSTATNGQLATYYQENGVQYPILVQIPRDSRLTLEQLKRLPVALAANGRDTLLLGQVATPEYAMGPNQISRQNRQRNLNVGGNLQDRAESEVQADVTQALGKLKLPQGTYWTFGQQQLQREREFGGLGLAIFLAIALIYMLLAAQFESFIYPLVVLVSVPMCAIGLVLALFLTNRSFGLTAFIGLLMLIGIVVKNGILLVDYTNQLRGRGVGRDEALLTAGHTRLRPILMTTLAAILGMLPLALGIGSGSEMYVPLATAVIGGLATSTLLTLLVVPTVYTFFDDLSRRFRKDPRDLAAPLLVVPSVGAVGEGLVDDVPAVLGGEKVD